MLNKREAFGIENFRNKNKPKIPEKINPELMGQIDKLDPDELAWLLSFTKSALEKKVGRKATKETLRGDRNSFKDVPDLEVAKQKAFDFLEKEGFISYSDEGTMICDLKKISDLKKLPSEQTAIFFKQIGEIYKSKYYGKGSINRMITILFDGQKVLSKEDNEKGIKETKELFYLPRTKEDALDIGKIKRSQFYLLPSDVVKIVNFQKTNFGVIPNKEEDSQKGLDYREALLAVLIYHPQYGAGYRDEKDGKLYLKRRDRKDQYGPVSAQYLSDVYGNFGNATTNKEYGSIQSGRLFVEKYLPELVSHKLLLPEDFGIMSKGVTAEKSILAKDFRQRGVVMINNVEHTVGNRFFTDDKRFKCYQLSPEKGVVVEDVDGDKKIKAVFNIFSEDKAKITPKGYRAAGVGMTKPIDLESSQENTREFDFLLGEGMNRYLETRDEIAWQCNFNLNKLPLKTQKQIITSVNDCGDEKEKKSLFDFIKKYKEDGLKTFLGFEDDRKLQERILKIGEIDSKLAWPIFVKANKSLQLIDNVKSEMAALWGKELPGNELESIKIDFSKRLESLLGDFFVRVKGKKKEAIWKEREELQSQLENFSESMLFWISAFHQMAQSQKERLKQDSIKRIPGSALRSGLEKMEKSILLELNGSKLDVFSGAEVAKNYDLIEKIESGYKEVYADERPKLGEALVASYDEKIKDAEKNEKIKVFVFQIGQNLAAHCRFDGEQDGKVYFGSFYVTKYGRGHLIGKYFLENALDSMGDRHYLHADCIPSESISANYISKQGFVVNKIVSDYVSLDEPFIFHIARSKTELLKETHYRKKDQKNIPIVSEEQIIEDFEKENFSEDEGRLILRFSIQKKVSKEMYPQEMKDRLTDLINNKGFVMTGYFFKPSQNQDEKKVYCVLEKLSDKADDLVSGPSAENGLE